MDNTMREMEEMILRRIKAEHAKGFVEGYEAGYKKGLEDLTEKILQKTKKAAP